MLRLSVIAVGPDKENWITSGILHYQTLLKRFADCQYHPLPSIRKAASMSPEQLMAAEAERIMSVCKGGDALVALAVEGERFSSTTFAHWLEQQSAQRAKRIVFVIGGAWGLDRALLQQASRRLSLSDLTMSHQVVRLVLFEQLYRACSILHHTDYHK